MNERPELPVFAHLRALAAAGPLVVAHRGNSSQQPENTLAAFRSAAQLGVPMQEFDVQATRDGRLVCLHDATFDRTSDAASRLGPGAMVAHTDWAVAQRLDAGSWFADANRGECIPTLTNALNVMLPHCIPLIEHKSGAAASFVAELANSSISDRCIVQSFDWGFVEQIGRLRPTLARAVLGPTKDFERCDRRAVAAAVALGVGMIHWHDRSLRRNDVEAAHAAGLLVCSYTTDDELGWIGGRAMGIDAMCTNDPAGMQAWRRTV